MLPLHSPLMDARVAERRRSALSTCGSDYECRAGHVQLDSIDCDGIHCHRACDEVVREECMRKNISLGKINILMSADYGKPTILNVRIIDDCTGHDPGDEHR